MTRISLMFTSIIGLVSPFMVWFSLQIGQNLPSEQVAYIVARGERGTIMLMDIHRRTHTRLMPLQQRPTYLDWSPDGQQLIMILPPTDQSVMTSTIVMYDLNSRQQQAYPIDVFARGLTWSPDGTRLDYAVGTEVYGMELVSTQSRRLHGLITDGDSRVYDLQWRMDGQQMIFNTRAWRFDNMYIYNADTREIQWLITRDLIDHVRWLPDQTHITFVSDERSIDIPLGIYTLSVTDADHIPTRITPESLSIPFFNLSPDGQHMIFSAFVNSSRETVLYMMDVSGEHLSTRHPSLSRMASALDMRQSSSRDNLCVVFGFAIG